MQSSACCNIHAHTSLSQLFNEFGVFIATLNIMIITNQYQNIHTINFNASDTVACIPRLDINIMIWLYLSQGIKSARLDDADYDCVKWHQDEQ